MTPLEFASGLRQHFGIRKAGAFLCPTSIITKKASLDIIKFDDWLHDQQGDYESNGDSMQSIIAKKYTPAAASFIKTSI